MTNALHNGRTAHTLARENLLINGDMSVWQREVTFTLGAGIGAYTADRWQIYTDLGATVQQISNNLNAAQIADCETVMQIAPVTTGNNYVGVFQPVENAHRMVGKTLTVSFYCNRLLPSPGLRGSIRSGGAAADVNFDPGFSYVAVPIKPPLTGTDHYRYFVTFAVPDITTFSGWGTPEQSSLLLGVQFVVPAGGIGGNINLYGFKAEEGDTVTDFVRRPRGEELPLCQRYYYPDTAPAAGVCFSATGASITVSFPVQMRFPVIMRKDPVHVLTAAGTPSGFPPVASSGASTRFGITEFRTADSDNPSGAFSSDYTADAEL